MADNIMVFFQGQQTLYTGLIETASTELGQVNSALEQARGEHATAVAQLSEQTRAIAAKRSAMSASGLMPADIELLAAELRTLLIEQRKQHTTLLTAADQVALLEQHKGQVEQRMRYLKSTLSDIETELEDATDRAARHAGWGEPGQRHAGCPGGWCCHRSGG